MNFQPSASNIMTHQMYQVKKKKTFLYKYLRIHNNKLTTIIILT